jgi:soluble lytic murein transglycosylase
MTVRLLVPSAIIVAIVVSAASSPNPAKAGSHATADSPNPAQAGSHASLAPSLPPPTYPAVVQIMKDPAQALAALDRELAAGADSAPIEALVLRAHLLSEAHRLQESVALWDEIGGRDDRLRGFTGRSAIADLLAARDVDRAAPRIRALVGPKPRIQDDLLLVGLAEAFQSARQPASAAEIYRGILARERQTAIGDRAHLGLAASEEAAGHLDSALTVLHQATITWRLPDTFSAARSKERRLAARLQRKAAALTPQEYFAVSARLTAASRFDDAVALLEDGARQHRVPAGDKLEAAIVENLYRGRRNDAAMNGAARFLSRFAASPLAPSVRLIQLRLDIRLGEGARARKRLETLQTDRSVPASVRRSAQRLVAADLVATGAARDGLAIYRQLLRTPLARKDRFDILWRAGVAAVRAGDDLGAIELLRQARKNWSGRSTPRSTLYWLAAALDRTGDAADARRLWTQLLDENACDYYGLRAAERLQRTSPSGPERSAASPPPAITAPAVASAEFQTAMILARAGLTDEAASMLGAAAARFRTDLGLALLTARAAAAAQDYATASAIVSTRFSRFLAHPASTGQAASTALDDVWRMAFPRAYWTEVQAAAIRSAVDPLLLLSLMRRESRFVATARSRAGALGLFQIMPYTAREIVPAAQDASEGDSLLDAPASADLAARLVKRILARFDGATAPVVAAYNAGEDRVEDWWRASRGLAEDLFVDTIPYGETRQYVREVLANYATYKRLYSVGTGL